MRTLPLLLALVAMLPAAAPPEGQRRGDGARAYEARQSGQMLGLREIERRVVPTMHGAQYLGFDFDSDSALYTLKFLRNGAVIWVQVDGRTGAIVGRSDR